MVRLAVVKITFRARCVSAEQWGRRRLVVDRALCFQPNSPESSQIFIFSFLFLFIVAIMAVVSNFINTYLKWKVCGDFLFAVQTCDLQLSCGSAHQPYRIVMSTIGRCSRAGAAYAKTQRYHVFCCICSHLGEFDHAHFRASTFVFIIFVMTSKCRVCIVM